MNNELQSLRTVVQRNCHISDAQFAGDYTLCVYLLKMREFYRWERGLAFSDRLPNDEVGDWLTAREALWEKLADQPYSPLSIGALDYQPYDNIGINQALRPLGYLYSGGLGNGCRPHFVLADLISEETCDDYRIVVAGREFARDLTAPPAMAIERTILIRRESMRRMLWEKIEEWAWRKQEGAMKRALSFYDVEHNLESALEAITDNEVDAAILHEIGEIRAGECLGGDWHEMLASLPHSQAELMARAVRDHLADCLSTLPALIKDPRPASLHFYFGNLRGMRKQIFPGAQQAYQQWIEQDRLERLQEIAVEGTQHWRDVARNVLELFREYGADSPSRIEHLIAENRL